MAKNNSEQTENDLGGILVSKPGNVGGWVGFREPVWPRGKALGW